MSNPFTKLLVIILSVYHGAVIAQVDIPHGWRAPKSQEIAYEGATWRNEKPNKFLEAQADFDSDGKNDDAKLLVSSNGEEYALFVFLGSGKTVRLAQEKTVHLQVMGIDLLQPGAHKTACGKGYWECKKGEPETLHLGTHGLLYFRPEGAASVYVWSSSAKGFYQVWLSD
jgi:hypothetical protein